MSDFFYYGQKDTIQRLNELAGRGAVVASTTPKMGMSPLGGPNGRITPAWLDPNIPIQQNARLCSGPTAKYGYSYLVRGAATPTCIWIANIPKENMGGHENLLIRGVLNDNWGASTTSVVNILMGVRNGFHVEWTMDGERRTQSRFLVSKQADGSYNVYAYFLASVFASISFDLVGISATTFAEPVITTTMPDGEVVFDTAQEYGAPGHIPPRYQGIPGAASTRFSGGLEIGNGGIETSFILPGRPTAQSGEQQELLRLGMGGFTGQWLPGMFSFMGRGGLSSTGYKEGYSLDIRAYDKLSAAFTPILFSVGGNRQVAVPGTLYVGEANKQEGTEQLTVASCVGAYAVSGNFGTNVVSALRVAASSATSRSITCGGTVNTQGNDYAEYIIKKDGCADVAPGQIIGITSENKVTDKWTDAVMFSIKSTAPSFVGGDNWSEGVGNRPVATAGQIPAQAVRREDKLEQRPVAGSNPAAYEEVVAQPGDSDAEWAEKQTAYANALADYNIAAQQDAAAMAAFDAALETARQKVDRIAIAGRVPVNVLGAQPGDYIVPVQDGAGIKGVIVHEDDLSMKQYLSAVGRVISIEADGRAYVMVKAV